MKTRFEIIVDHTVPIDPERIGAAISESLKPIMNIYNKKYKGSITQSTVNIIEHNAPDGASVLIKPQ